MIYIIRKVNSDGDYTIQEQTGRKRYICAGRVFLADEDLSGIVDAQIIQSINDGDVIVVPYVAPEEPTLSDAKADKILAIDSKTSELIKAGFSYDDNSFSMSDAAQRNWTGLAAAYANGWLSFPMSISTVDESSYTIEDDSSFVGFMVAYLSYQVSATAPLATGRALKAQVEACTTVSEVEAIVDNR